jgi:hypothetical protein
MFFPIGTYTGINWMPLLVFAIIAVVIIGGLVYANTGGRFLKKEEYVVVKETESEKVTREKREWYAIIAIGFLMCLPALILPFVILILVFVLGYR